MSDGARKRSRFDQTEPDTRRNSRFDRRSRSPETSSRHDSRRSRSPIDKASSRSPNVKHDPAAAAAAAAAKINAQIQAKKGPQGSASGPIGSAMSATSGKGAGASNVNGEVYQQDGDFIKDIEVNDLRNRYTLTKGATQKMIKDETGADVTTRGNYYPDKSMATAANPPLYLHITSQSKEGLDQAIEKIEELMKQELPNLVDERRFRRREPEPVERDEMGRRKWPEERLPIDLEPIPGFNLRAQVIGHGGSYVKHIAGETGCRVQIKGRGSGFYEQATGQESDDPMFLHVFGPDANEVQHAKELCEDLLVEVKKQYQEFKERGGPANHRPHNNYGDNYNQDHGQGHRGYGRGNNHNHNQPDYSGRNPHSGYGNGGYNNPASAGGAGQMNLNNTQQQTAQSGQDYAQQYAQYYGSNMSGAATGSAASPGLGGAGSPPGASGTPGAAGTSGQDPYAAYGGYQNYVQMYYQYYAMQQQAAQQGAGDQSSAAPGAAPGTSSDASAPPPPPPAESAPPPPPPSAGPPGTSGSGGGSYSSVPPPPGM